ncbi:lysine decarboxylase family protein [Besnoitia besnoiti]|uniref:Lysine decarboxylase family protein n=1 Tax=Besnoitia besnoiti TaxID=94643 RepID=A0A2A9MLX4_BESBE|nr:lysine decarboxylase family protein [Besnoitia besnoiti]PFH36753.1 lysine decarboxylase family protein [Besnoitia besnoiti]
MSATGKTEGSQRLENGSEVKAEAPALRVPTKSYSNTAWLHSRSARQVRILCEYLEVRDRLRRSRVLATFLVFGTARGLSREQWQARMTAATDRLSQLKAESKQDANTKESQEIESAEREITRLRRLEWVCEFAEKVTRLTRRLAEWLLTPEARTAVAKILREIPTPLENDDDWGQEASALDEPDGVCPVAICTGGGPGLMEAANKGAAQVPGARSIGMGISLPFESGLNPYVSKELGFQFQYFFTRKFWMVYSALGVIAAPGGVGTLDELMEVLTLKQTKKMKRDIPIVLFGKTYWDSVLNFDKMVEYGMISECDRDQLFLTDDEDEAFEYLRSFLLQDKLVLGEGYVHKSLRKRRRE